MAAAALRFDEASLRIEKLAAYHRVEVFDCEDSDIEAFLKEDALRYQEQGVALTKLLIYEDRIVGYFSLATDAIRLRGSEWKRLPGLPEGFEPPPEWPALKLARMGTQKEYKERGFAKLMVRLARGLAVDLSQDAGCRFLTVDAYASREGWYAKRDFVRNLRRTEALNAPAPRTCGECGQEIPDDAPGEHAAPEEEEENVSMRLDLFNPQPPPPRA